MQNKIQLLNVVALAEDMPDYKLSRGQVGTVVEELSAEAVLVEFSDDQGKTYAMHLFTRQQLIVLYFEPLESQVGRSSVAAMRFRRRSAH